MIGVLYSTSTTRTKNSTFVKNGLWSSVISVPKEVSKEIDQCKNSLELPFFQNIGPFSKLLLYIYFCLLCSLYSSNTIITQFICSTKVSNAYFSIAITKSNVFFTKGDILWKYIESRIRIIMSGLLTTLWIQLYVFIDKNLQ